MYRNDCLRLFRLVINQSLIVKNDIEKYPKEQAFVETCHLYEERFGSLKYTTDKIRILIKLKKLGRH
jgi:hypothetical protein